MLGPDNRGALGCAFCRPNRPSAKDGSRYSNRFSPIRLAREARHCCPAIGHPLNEDFHKIGKHLIHNIVRRGIDEAFDAPVPASAVAAPVFDHTESVRLNKGFFSIPQSACVRPS